MPTARRISLVLLKIVLGFLIVLILLVLALMVLWPEENWRGRRVLARCEDELRARGEKLDLASFIPPPVPDAQNFWMAPLLAPLAIASQQDLDQVSKLPGSPVERLEKVSLNLGGTSKKWPGLGDYEIAKPVDLVGWQRYLQGDTTQDAAIDQREVGRAVLTLLHRWSPELEEFSAAANRPYARFPLDYSKGLAMPVPHVNCLFRFAQVYRLRCVAALEVGDTASALQDLKTLDRMQAAVRAEPLLLSYVVRLAIIKFLMQPIWQGSVEHLWNEDKLRDIQAMLGRIDLITDYAWVLRGERAYANLSYSKFRAPGRGATSIFGQFRGTPRQFWVFALLPNDAVMCQNQAANERWVQDILPAVDGPKHRIYPAKDNQAVRVIANTKSTPYNMAAKMSGTTDGSMTIRTAATQVAIDEAVVACALERFRLRNADLPAALDTLVPEYLEALPHDVIDGGRLRYCRRSSDSYLLYCVGWNEVDDEGIIVPKSAEHPSRDNEKGDWVWPSTGIK